MLVRRAGGEFGQISPGNAIAIWGFNHGPGDGLGTVDQLELGPKRQVSHGAPRGAQTKLTGLPVVPRVERRWTSVLHANQRAMDFERTPKEHDDVSDIDVALRGDADDAEVLDRTGGWRLETRDPGHQVRRVIAV